MCVRVCVGGGGGTVHVRMVVRVARGCACGRMSDSNLELNESAPTIGDRSSSPDQLHPVVDELASIVANNMHTDDTAARLLEH